MRLTSVLLSSVAVIVASTSHMAVGAITSSTTHAAGGNDLNGLIAVGDAISGLVATELAGDNGWHEVTPVEPERLMAFTDDAGPISGLTGLLNDFPGAGNPTKRLQYDLTQSTDIKSIQILTGNFGGDGRVFSTAVIKYSTDNGSNFSPLGGYVPTIGANSAGYYQSDASGTVNNGQWQSTLLRIFDDSGSALATGVTNLTIELYSADNSDRQARDPFDGLNPFTGIDDGFDAAISSPLVWEIDVVAVPEPVSCILMLAGLGGALLCRKRA